MRFDVIAVAGLMMAVGVAQAQQVKAPEPQVPTEQQKKAMVVLQGRETALQGSCPGALRASQQATGGATVWTTALEDQKDAAKVRPSGLGVHVDFQVAHNAVKQLELRVSYEPLGLKRVPVAPGTNGSATATSEREKNFNLDREAAMKVDADLLVGPAATITSVHLMSATFADGSVWRAPTPDSCSVVPSRFVLVKSK
ncbi:MAG TPA: hypothetical protein VGU25_12300 [Acidobacteriaceae bacterium]|nr:hypothetical protein [Acidobacteriaceae bacterium]